MRRKREKLWRTVAIVAIAVVFVAYLAPLFWLVLCTFKDKVQIFSTIPQLLFPPTLRNYRMVLMSDLFGRPFRQSVAVTTASTLLTLFLGTTSGYVFSRFRMRMKRDIMLFILLTRMIPPVVLLIPVYILYIRTGLQDTFLGLMLIYTNMNLAFSVWMMKGFIDNVPFTIEEAAMCDGYTRFHVFWRVVVPMVVPGLLATAVFCGIFAWNEFLFAQILTRSRFILMPVKIYSTNFFAAGLISTVSFLFVLPVIIFTYLIRKQLLYGVTFGVIRGR
jgi:multiple sugar transport system permease protein